VVTTGRTGSTMLSLMLKDHPAILSLSETLSSLTSRALTDRVLGRPGVPRPHHDAEPGAPRHVPQWHSPG
jgi:hypothetical protein